MNKFVVSFTLILRTPGIVQFFAAFLVLAIASCGRPTGSTSASEHDPTEAPRLDDRLLKFHPYSANPVFTGTGNKTWDRHIRERGYILFEDGTYHLWYTGFTDDESDMHLGYATSRDGIDWTRYANNPIVNEGWVEDMMVIKRDSIYYMFAEGRNDVAHLLTSTDRVHWKEQGSLDVRYKDGRPLSPGPYGTPTAWYEGDTWYLLYERGDLGIWLATSTDLKTWTNVDDDPVIRNGPEPYDKYGVAVNQVVMRDGVYYAYYHATALEDWSEWSSCVATSTDRLHWKKYSGNPILRENKSSPITVYDGQSVRLYTMHPQVALHTSEGN